MNRSSIPTKLTDYNVYNEGECLIGIEAEVTLPELAAVTSEIAGGIQPPCHPKGAHTDPESRSDKA